MVYGQPQQEYLLIHLRVMLVKYSFSSMDLSHICVKIILRCIELSFEMVEFETR